MAVADAHDVGKINCNSVDYTACGNATLETEDPPAAFASLISRAVLCGDQDSWYDSQC